ncbi:hypothetical protein ACWED2_16930 [Amycolatopsis sp. NPDC005003]
MPIALAAVSMVALALPAEAASTTVVAEGSTATLNYTFQHASGTSLTITVTDTKCNANPAVGEVGLYGRNGQFDYVEYKNSSGCHGGARSYSTGYFIEPYDIINIRLCARGGGPIKCSGYIDNPYT